MELRIHRSARERYDIRGPILAPGISSPAFNLPHVAEIASKLPGRTGEPALKPRPSELGALVMIDAIFRRIIERYSTERYPGFHEETMDAASKAVGTAALDDLLLSCARQFPPASAYGDQDALFATGPGARRESMVLALLLRVTSQNPAAEPFSELVGVEDPGGSGALVDVFDACKKQLDSAPVFGPDSQNLLDMLLTPAKIAPESLVGQLAYILSRWGFMVPEMVSAIMRTIDIAKEEGKWFERGGEWKAGLAPVPDFRGGESEPEAYSQDLDWMPRTVLIAKNTWVWLDQLSRKYSRVMERLDQVPDEELDMLASWGITGLWLIGVWERSRASGEIKKMMGNPEALASAYSLMKYEVAADLGGSGAFENLKSRAWRRGIRMATDMVPNHTGVDSHWVMDHPERFIQSPHPPYPVYGFEGPELSWRDDVSIRIESRYWTRQDAAVVFRRVDRRTGETRYIYHGNDGTSTPWNDTAQLNFLDPVVRESVIREILEVAKKSPIIRFDAAMTLAKRHFQRLWFPEPGSGGAIPSRAERGMTRAEFDAAIPVEFWREVVDRVQAEQPQTLLLAEAFWLMEGYFVRTLGMHRVYNSAFMNMLAREDNAKYRQVMKNTLEFDTEVLKRFVNFMSNPDEETSVNQFGKGDKYFGICTLMCAMPGLPMFGHGQVEGFTEKYGMEYRRAYRDEKPDSDLVARHEREIFPLLRRRRLFAGSENFRLYDFQTGRGSVNEDVFALSNMLDSEKALVLYNNRYASAAGFVRWSVSYSARGRGDGRELARETLAQGLRLSGDDRVFYAFRDLVSGLEYLRSGKDMCENGLYVELGAFKTCVFLDFREIADGFGADWRRLCERLRGAGAPSLDKAMAEMHRAVLMGAFVKTVASAIGPAFRAASGDLPAAREASAALRDKISELVGAAAAVPGLKPDAALALESAGLIEAKAASAKAMSERVGISRDAGAALALHSVARVLDACSFIGAADEFARETSSADVLSGLLAPYAGSARRALDLFHALRELGPKTAAPIAGGAPGAVFAVLVKNEAARRFMGVNEWQGALWFSKDGLRDFCAALVVLAVADGAGVETARNAASVFDDLGSAAEQAGYRLDKMEAALSAEEEPGDGVQPEDQGPAPDLGA